MSKPERLPHPGFSHSLPARLREIADDQKAIHNVDVDPFDAFVIARA